MSIPDSYFLFGFASATALYLVATFTALAILGPTNRRPVDANDDPYQRWHKDL